MCVKRLAGFEVVVLFLARTAYRLNIQEKELLPQILRGVNRLLAHMVVACYLSQTNVYNIGHHTAL